MPKDQFITWAQLSNQFGNTLGKPSHFKEKFIRALKIISLLYVGAKFSILDKGLLLKRSKTHVPMREAKMIGFSVNKVVDNKSYPQIKGGGI